MRLVTKVLLLVVILVVALLPAIGITMLLFYENQPFEYSMLIRYEKKT